MYGGDEVGAMVMDLGSGALRLGFAGEDMPKAVFSSIAGTSWVDDTTVATKTEDTSLSLSSTETKTPPPLTSTAKAEKRKKYFVGPSAQIFREQLEIEYPVQHGLVTDWGAVEAMWDLALRKHLRIPTNEHPLLLSESPYNTYDRRERLAQLAFETFDAPAIFISKSPCLASFAQGRATSLVIDSGAGVTSVCGVSDGYVIQRSLVKTRVGGDALDGVLERLINNQSSGNRINGTPPDGPPLSFASSSSAPSFTPSLILPRYCLRHEAIASTSLSSSTAASSTRDHRYICELPRGATPSYHHAMTREIIRDIKESMCRVSEVAFDAVANAKIPTLTYELPDGRVLEVGTDRFTVPEQLFAPSPDLLDLKGDFDGYTFDGLDGMVRRSIDGCDVDIRKELYSGIVLTGGTTLFPGLTQRLTKELNKNLPPAFKVKIAQPASSMERKFGVWLGGSILASLGSFHQMWFSKQEYDEHGASLLARKCP